MEESETLYISPSASLKWSDFKNEANKRHITLSKFAYISMKNELRKVNIGTFFEGISFVFITIILLKVVFL